MPVLCRKTCGARPIGAGRPAPADANQSARASDGAGQAPEFQGRSEPRQASYQWAASQHESYMKKVEQAIGNEIAKDEKEKAEKAAKN